MSERQLETLDLNLVLTLHWLLTEQSVSRAADRLGVSQPAVSHGLKRLRDAFGDPLLVKSGKVMRTTPRAERMKPTVARVIEEMRDLFQTESSFDPASAKGRFRIAATDNWAVIAAKGWEEAAARQAPGISLDIVAIDFPVAQDLISGAVDMVVLPETKLLDLPPGLDVDQFVQRPFCEEVYLTGLPSGGGAKPSSLEAYAEARHVLVNPAGASFGIVDERLRERDLTRFVAYRTESFLAGAAIARETGCMLTAPRSTFVAAPHGFTIIPLPLPIDPFAMLTGWHPNWTGDPRHRWLREKLTAGINSVLTRAPWGETTPAPAPKLVGAKPTSQKRDRSR